MCTCTAHNVIAKHLLAFGKSNKSQIQLSVACNMKKKMYAFDLIISPEWQSKSWKSPTNKSASKNKNKNKTKQQEQEHQWWLKSHVILCYVYHVRTRTNLFRIRAIVLSAFLDECKTKISTCSVLTHVAGCWYGPTKASTPPTPTNQISHSFSLTRFIQAHS